MGTAVYLTIFFTDVAAMKLNILTIFSWFWTSQIVAAAPAHSKDLFKRGNPMIL